MMSLASLHQRSIKIMKIFGIELKKEYVLTHMQPHDKIWICEEPTLDKKDFETQIKWLKHKNSKIKIKTKFTLMF